MHLLALRVGTLGGKLRRRSEPGTSQPGQLDRTERPHRSSLGALSPVGRTVMMLLTNRMAATRRYIASMILRCGPSSAALGYPLALVLLHQSGRQFVQATDATGTLLAGFAVCITVALVYSVPVLSFVVILQSGGQVRMRRLAHLAFAAPPPLTAIGVVFFFL